MDAQSHQTTGPAPHQESHDSHYEHEEHTGHASSLDDPATDAVHSGHAVEHGRSAVGGEHAAHVDHTGHENLFRNRFWISLALSIPVLAYSEMIQMWFGFRAPAFPGSTWVAPVFSLVVFLVGGVPFLRMAVPEIRNRQPGMMLLISLAITVAFLYSLAMTFVNPASGFFWEMVLLIDVMLLGHWLEMRSVRQASGALGELAKLMPDMAERIADGGETEAVRAVDLRSGDLILVRPGASVPADGVVEEGRSEVNEALITGESQPVDKEPGSKVIAGTVNEDGSLRVRVTATGDATALAGIMRLVDEAERSKSATQVLADRAAGWLFYIAVAAAAITGVAWLLVTGPSSAVVERVATVLVIACPHALGLAVPLVVAISTSLAARNGILVRSRRALEEARTVDTVLFDKTGTLTRGEQGVAGIAAAHGWGEEQALALAAAAEGDSEHAIARAIRQTAAERNLSHPRVTNFEAIKGRGVRVAANGRTVHLGGPRLLELLDAQPPPELAAFAQAAGGRGQSVIYLVDEGKPVAAFALADVVRPESKDAVRRLQESGVEVAMITGDSKAVAGAVARELGIERVYAEVLPEHKAQHVAGLQAEGRRVAMVGDGVNDAPALARADVGIAIGSGTDVAIESAGIILVQSDPADVVNVFNLSRASYRKMVQNLWWATGYNIVALPLAAGILAPVGILLSPAVGALLMSLSTIIVALNAQLLRRLDLQGN